MTRTVKTGDDVDAALAFLGRQLNPQVNGEAYFQLRMNDVISQALKEADEKRFKLVSELMDDKNKGASITKLRELLSL